MPAILLDAYSDWECPACGLTERTRPLPPNTARFHPCPGLHGLTAPLARAGSGCKLTATLREDYEDGEILTRGDDGRPWMNILTHYPDGRNDCLVFAPLARAVLAG